jgi:leader peptidase (prepilin peptidase)/N-methyltransferase
MPAPLAWFVVGVLGLAIGSFLNVCIWRLPPLVLTSEPEQDDNGDGRRRSGLCELLAWQRDVWRDAGRALVRLSTPPSACPACGAPIAWYHNIPIFSWFVLGRRCASCRAAISPRYPTVEGATAAIFLVHLAVFGWGPLLFVRLAFATALIVLFVIDLEHHLLPDVITIPGLVFALLASTVLPPGPLAAVLGALLGAGVLWAVSEGYFRWRGIEGLGFGDVKMLAMVGAFLGWQGTLITLVLGSVSGALLGLALIAGGRGSLRLELPFGTFLAIGALVASLWGNELAAWYLSLFPTVE